MLKKREFRFLFVLTVIIAIVFSGCGDPGDGDNLDSIFLGPGPADADGIVYYVGDEGPGGGIIFYVHEDPEGFTVQGYGDDPDDEGYFPEYTAYYLEAAPSNWGSRVIWGARGTLIDNITTWNNATAKNAGLQDSIGSGRKDTQIIVAFFRDNSPHEDWVEIAAQVATGSFGGKNDWFLPSLGELNLLYINRAYVGNLGALFYWSSTQYSNEHAWFQQFNSAFSHNGNGKNLVLNVRAIRAF